MSGAIRKKVRAALPGVVGLFALVGASACTSGEKVQVDLQTGGAAFSGLGVVSRAQARLRVEASLPARYSDRSAELLLVREPPHLRVALRRGDRSDVTFDGPVRIEGPVVPAAGDVWRVDGVGLTLTIRFPSPPPPERAAEGAAAVVDRGDDPGCGSEVWAPEAPPPEEPRDEAGLDEEPRDVATDDDDTGCGGDPYEEPVEPEPEAETEPEASGCGGDPMDDEARVAEAAARAAARARLAERASRAPEPRSPARAFRFFWPIALVASVNRRWRAVAPARRSRPREA